MENIESANQQLNKRPAFAVSEALHGVESDFFHAIDDSSMPSFIFEGKRAGQAEILLVAQTNGQEICSTSVSLDLHDIEWFYSKYVLGADSNGVVAATCGANSNETGYEPGNDTYFLFVHGWNMQQYEKDRWAETVFKRLWWMGYKGHVGCFQWPTLTDFWTYDASEIRAWNSAWALRGLLEQLQIVHHGNVHVMAHSMGNVVMGEALRGASGMLARTYVAAQAAVPASCYDSDLSNAWDNYTTPDIYAHYPNGDVSATCYFSGNSQHVGRMFQYYNPLDYALKWWKRNNDWKPDIHYQNIDGDGNRDSYLPATGDMFCYSPFIGGERILTLPDDRFEVFARIVESRTLALGTMGNVDGFEADYDLTTWGYGKNHYSHSREFRSNIIADRAFWKAIFDNIK